MKRAPIIVALLAAATLSLAACGPQQTSAKPSTESAGPTVTAQPGTGETIPSQEPTTPTCENLISDTVVKQYQDVGFTAQQSQIYGVDALLPDSIQCTWGDNSETSTEAVLVYGWSPIDAATAQAMQESLIAQGWTKEVDGDNVYITAGKRSPILDENGYGMTYLFGDGWLSYADTKQGLLLITWPR